jgi:hypothetical protein
MMFGPIMLCVWFVAAIVGLAATNRWTPQFSLATASGRVSLGLWSLAVLALCVWIPILPATQREQHLRGRVEAQLREGRLREAVQEMSRHQPADFPPHWDPPPRLGYGEDTPLVFAVVRQIEATRAAPWVRAIYIAKLEQRMYDDLEQLPPSDIEYVRRYVELINALPEGPKLIGHHRGEVESILKHHGDLSEQHRTALTSLLETADRQGPTERE